VASDLLGVESHGVPLLAGYVPRIERGAVNLTPNIRTVKETPVMAVIDGDNGLGQVVGTRAMELCLKKTKESGMAMVVARNSNHYGMAGYYARMALPHDFIGMSSTNATPTIVPTFGKAPAVGNNPIAIAIPAGEEPPFSLDMATSTVAMGKVSIALRKEEQLKPGWAYNENLGFASDPAAILKSRMLTPLGGLRDTGGQKGYGLAVAMEVFCGLLSGASFGSRHLTPEQRERSGPNLGHFFMAVDVSLFQPLEEFKAWMDEFLRYLKATPKAPGHDRIYTAGEIEHEKQKDYLQNGIVLHPKVVDNLRSLADKYDIPFEILREKA